MRISARHRILDLSTTAAIIALLILQGALRHRDIQITVKKLFVETHGCQMNEYDSARMRGLLGESHDMIETDSADEADVILLNTCSIREKAQEKVFHQLGRWKKLKDNNPNLVIGVGGCVASQEGEGIAKRAPFVDLIFGPQTLHRLPEMIQQHRQDDGCDGCRYQLSGN